MSTNDDSDPFIAIAAKLGVDLGVPPAAPGEAIQHEVGRRMTLRLVHGVNKPLPKTDAEAADGLIAAIAAALPEDVRPKLVLLDAYRRNLERQAARTIPVDVAALVEEVPLIHPELPEPGPRGFPCDGCGLWRDEHGPQGRGTAHHFQPGRAEMASMLRRLASTLATQAQDLAAVRRVIEEHDADDPIPWLLPTLSDEVRERLAAAGRKAREDLAALKARIRNLDGDAAPAITCIREALCTDETIRADFDSLMSALRYWQETARGAERREGEADARAEALRAALAKAHATSIEDAARVLDDEAAGIRAIEARAQQARADLVKMGANLPPDDSRAGEIGERLAGWFDSIAARIRALAAVPRG